MDNTYCEHEFRQLVQVIYDCPTTKRVKYKVDFYQGDVRFVHALVKVINYYCVNCGLSINIDDDVLNVNFDVKMSENVEKSGIRLWRIVRASQILYVTKQRASIVVDYMYSDHGTGKIFPKFKHMTIRDVLLLLWSNDDEF